MSAQLVQDLELVVGELGLVFEQGPPGASTTEPSGAQGPGTGSRTPAGRPPGRRWPGSRDGRGRRTGRRGAPWCRWPTCRPRPCPGSRTAAGPHGSRRARRRRPPRHGGSCLAHPDHCALAVVIGHDAEVAVTPSVADLVDPDPVELVQPGVVNGVGHHVDHDLGHRLLADQQQLGDRRLVRPLGQPGHHVLEVARMPGVGSGPAELLGAHPLTARAVDANDFGLQEAPMGSEIEVAPAAHRAVVDRSGLPPARTAVPGPPAPDADHDPFGGKGDQHHGGPDEGQHLVECSGDARVFLLARWTFGRDHTYEGDACASLREKAPAIAGTAFMVADGTPTRQASRVRCVSLWLPVSSIRQSAEPGSVLASLPDHLGRAELKVWTSGSPSSTRQTRIFVRPSGARIVEPSPEVHLVAEVSDAAFCGRGYEHALAAPGTADQDLRRFSLCEGHRSRRDARGRRMSSP